MTASAQQLGKVTDGRWPKRPIGTSWVLYRRMQAWRWLRSHGAEVVPLAIVLGAPAEGFALNGHFSPTLAGAAAAAGLALLPRRRWPLVRPVGAVAAISVVAWWGDDAFWHSTVVLGAILLAAWKLGRDNSIGFAAAGALAVVPFLVGFELLAPASVGLNPFANYVLPAGCWLAGLIVRRRCDAAAGFGRRAAAVASARNVDIQRAVLAERARIARELHDVVAHTLTVMTLQAGGARMHLENDSERALHALRTVEAAGSEALGELRRMVSVVNRDTRVHLEPQPGLDGLGPMVEGIRSAGLDLAVTVEGNARRFSPGLELAAYRIIQEALTNAIRHGQGSARLLVDYRSDVMRIEVVNDVGSSYTRGSGSGLIGIAERVALYGGSFEAGPQAEGRYVMRVDLPLEQR